jgi:hypothetical protein
LFPSGNADFCDNKERLQKLHPGPNLNKIENRKAAAMVVCWERGV